LFDASSEPGDKWIDRNHWSEIVGKRQRIMVVCFAHQLVVIKAVGLQEVLLQLELVQHTHLPIFEIDCGR